MAWYDTGTVSVTLNSSAITGVGTQWLSGVRQGEAFVGPDGRLYEVLNVASNTSLTLTKAYRGATAAGQQYALAPMQGYTKELADRAATLLMAMQTDYASVLRWADAQDASAVAAFDEGKLVTSGAFGVGNMSRTWSAVTAGSSTGRWAKLCTVRAQGANRRGVLTVMGGAIGYGSGSDHSSAVGFLSLTSGNNTTQDNLLVDYVHTAGAYTTGATGQTAIIRLKTVRLETNWDFEVWALVGPHTQINLHYVGDLRIEPHANAVQDIEPAGGYDKTARIFQIWTSNGLNANNIGSVMGLKTAAFVDLIGDAGTGAAMQSGSNTNGEWWRFQNGLMICQKSGLIRQWFDQAYSSALWASRPLTWTFPSSFAANNIPTVGGHPGANTGHAFIGQGGTATTNNLASFINISGWASSSEGAFSVFAIGRWK